MPNDPKLMPELLASEGRALQRVSRLETQVNRLQTIDAPATTNTFTYFNGWRTYSGALHVTFGRAGFWRDREGVVHLDGLFDKTGGNFVAGETMAQLPIGFRPYYSEVFIAMAEGAGPPVTAGAARVDVQAAGWVVLQSGAPINPVNYVSVSGISFRAKPN